MTTPHLIRLRAPWECRVVPRDERGADDPPAVHCTRHFNAPTNLDADERVWLVCDAVDFQARFALNGHRLGTIEGHCPQPRLDLTEKLRPHNVLAIEIELAPDGAPPEHVEYGPRGLPGGIGEVWLEIARHVTDWKIETLDPR
ncbi:MAG: hypothetical protein AB7O59_22690 [Pirellulales bacterium]